MSTFTIQQKTRKVKNFTITKKKWRLEKHALQCKKLLQEELSIINDSKIS